MNCVFCKKVFHNRSKSALYCTDVCRLKAFKLRHPKRFKEYNKRYFSTHPRKRKPITIFCVCCKKSFKQMRKDVRFCSVICYRKDYYQHNKTKRSAYTKQWIKDNPNRVKAHARKNYQNHKELFQHASVLRKARIRNAEGSHTLAEWNKLKEKFNNSCACCKKQEPEIKLTRDHVVPLIKGGSNYISNIQPLCQPCNGSKHTRLNCQRTH